MSNNRQTTYGYNWSGRIDNTTRIASKRGRRTSALSRQYGEYTRNEWERHTICMQETGRWDEY